MAQWGRRPSPGPEDLRRRALEIAQRNSAFLSGAANVTDQPRYADELSPVVHIAIDVVRATFGISTENALARLLIVAMRRESLVEGSRCFCSPMWTESKN